MNSQHDRFGELRKQAEALLQARPDTPDTRHTSPDILELIHELDVHQAELEIQNEELRRAQEVITALRREYEELYEFAPCGYVTLNAKGIITHANLTAVTLLGVERNRLVGSGLTSAFATDRQDAFLAARKKAGTTGEKQCIPLRLAARNGNGSQATDRRTLSAPEAARECCPTWVQTEIEADRGDDNEVGRWRIILVDITELKRTEERRRELEAQLRQAQKLESIGQLAGGVAHDFNNLLMGVMNYAELSRDGLEADHPVQQWLDEITHESERSARIVQQLLAFSRKQIIAPKVLDLNATVESMLKMLRRLIGEDIDLLWQPGANLHTIKIDPGQVDQILANLCVNARDAIGGTGRITVETGNTTLDADYCAAHVEAIPGDYAMLVVSDDGCGMDEATRAGVFEPFFSTKPKNEGTGLGLATVYGIVKQNGGSIDAYSEPGEGTTFRIYLPHCPEAVEQEVQANATDTAVHGSETILLVEDEKSIRVTARLFLEAVGYTVLAAESPAAALQCVKERGTPPDLLVTDVVMPGMSGRELAEQLRKEHEGLKVLFMSGYTSNAIAHHGILDDYVDFMPKPITRDTLLRKVREVLDGE